ncbi:MAG: hypothetical protein QM687_14250 [Ferruginibacter sp.]
MKLSIFLITLFLITLVHGQPVKKIEQLLKDKNLFALNSYIEKPQKSNVTFSWETLRTIVEDYQEGIIKIEEHLPVNDETGGSTINNYRIYLLADKNKIFYYRFINTACKNIHSGQLEENVEIIDSLKDGIEYSSLENIFKQTYNADLNSDDLFLTSIVYGAHCGIAGVNPVYMEQLNMLLQNEDIDIIRQWLKSANAEKQLYALKGYRILVNLGYKLTDEERTIIPIVEQKKGSVSTCSGCIYQDETFQSVVAEINSIPSEYLRPERINSSGIFFKKKKDMITRHSSFSWIFVLIIIAVLSILYLFWRIRKDRIQL